MHFIDEEQHVAGRAGLTDERAQALLVLSAIGRARQQPDCIERQQPQVAHREGHTPLRDPQCQPFRNGGLANAGLTDERGVVLPLSKQNVDGARDLLIPAADDLQAASACVGGEISREAIQRLRVGVQGVGHEVDEDTIRRDRTVRGRGRFGGRDRHVGTNCVRRCYITGKTLPNSASPQTSMITAEGARKTPNGTSGNCSGAVSSPPSASSVCCVTRPRRTSAMG